MNHKTIEEISKRMAGIDIAILSTHTDGGRIANRPMSNNGDVKYDGTSYYFTFEQARTHAKRSDVDRLIIANRSHLRPAGTDPASPLHGKTDGHPGLAARADERRTGADQSGHSIV